jgi:hypothetical protein
MTKEVPGPSPLWPQGWIDHVAELAREMEARRLDPDRPVLWARGLTIGCASVLE